MKITAAVVGAGQRGLDHAAALCLVPEISLVGIADIDPKARARAVAQSSRPTWASATTMVREARPSFLVLATPPAARSAAFVSGLLETANGCVKLLLVEKPLALCWEEAGNLVDLCEKHGVVLAGGFQLRCSPEFKLLKEALSRDAIGRVQSVETSCYGNLLDQGCHLLDMVDWIDGGGFAWSEMKASDDLPALTESHPLRPDWRPDINHPAPHWCEGRIGLDSGVTVEWGSGLRAPQPVPALGPWLQKRVRVIGSRGIAEAHVANEFRLLDAENCVREQHRFKLADYAGATAEMHARIARKLISPCEPCPVPTGRELLRVMGAIEASFASVLEGGARRPSPSLALSSFAMQRWRQQRESDRAVRLQESTSRLQTARPAISILLSLEDHRGMAESAVASWVAQSGVEPESYELVLVTNPRTAALGERLRPQLRAWDRLLPTHCGPWDDMREYQVAAAAAQAKCFFITEPHCLAEPETILRICERFATVDEAGFFCRSKPICHNAIARMETRYFEAGLREWSQPDDWRKVVLRGFGIRAQVFHAIGGFRFEFLRFSEWLLGADLKRRGYRLGYAPEISVQHCYSDSLGLLDEFILIFTEGECRYRMQVPRGGDELFFPAPPEWSDSVVGDRAAWRLSALAIARSMLSGILPLAAGDDLVRCLLRGILGQRAASWTWRLRVLWHKAGVHFFTFLGLWNRCYQAFVSYYESQTSAVRVRFLFRHPLPVPDPPAKHSNYPIEQVGDGDLLGFHRLEQQGGRPFRWTGWHAALRVFPPRTSRRLVVRAHPFLPRGAESAGGVEVFLGSRKLCPLPRKTRRLEFSVPADALRNEPQWLSIITRPFHAPGDARRLGLPLSRLSFHRT